MHLALLLFFVLLSPICLADMTSGELAASSVNTWVQGKISRSYKSLDLAISGNGFFILESNEGKLSYTRHGKFEADANGSIVYHPSGENLLDIDHNKINLSKFVRSFPIKSIRIKLDGKINLIYGNGKIREVATIGLAIFSNPFYLLKIGKHTFESLEIQNSQTLSPQVSIAGSIYSSSLEDLDTSTYEANGF